MKATLSQRLGQNLTMTPHLLQAIGLLQLDAIRLEQEVRRVLDSNPMLEACEDDPVDGAEDCIEIDAEGPIGHAFERTTMLADGESDDIFARLPAGESTDMRLNLLEQLALRGLAEDDLALAALILDHVADSGYLEVAPEHLADAARTAGLAAERIEAVRHLLMRCEPEGIGARDVRECLAVQLAELREPTPGRSLARRIIEGHLELLASHDPLRMAKALNIEPEQAAEAMAVVLRLDPRPGARLARSADAVVPDVRIEPGRRGWRVVLNRRCTPRIRIDPISEQLLDRCDRQPGTDTLRELLQQARWFARGLCTRHETLLKVVAAIVEHQQAFLRTGAGAMAPLTLKQIADAVGVHESTVSRITTGKYVQTPFGTFELKRFFAVRLEGAEVSGPAVQSMVRKLIETEAPSAPLPDDAIVVLLARQGVRIARRTVAKYRDIMGIAPARERQRRGRSLACAH
ncbi:MAG TPA: RNA polymerase sigma-54 factor [Xanthomonadales bacterium]|nr:RNA polymerase sigma-54 factor [Xanthomonadales bacterium]